MGSKGRWVVRGGICEDVEKQERGKQLSTDQPTVRHGCSHAAKTIPFNTS